jgi:hypothetical protein
MRSLRSLLRTSEPGQAVVFVALALVVLVGLTGLAVDGSNAFNQRRNATNGADAAAIAGTRALTAQHRAGGGASSAVYQEVQSYLEEHRLDEGLELQWSAYYVDRHANRLSSGAQVANSSADVPSSARGVEVELRYRFSTFFMPILGRPDLTVDADATAVFGPVSQVVGGDLIPLAISQTAAQSIAAGNDTFIFGTETGAFQVTPGNFGQVSFDPDGDNATGNYNQDCIGTPAVHQDSQSRWWCQGSQYPIAIGDELYGQTGTLSNSLADEMQWRIDNRPRGLVPVFGYTNDLPGNNTKFTIVGFMAIELEAFDVTGSNSSRWVRARKLDYFTTAGSFSSGAADTGVYAINLVK